MNCDEISEIKKTWEIPAASPTESGVAILIQFFTKYPSNLEKFSTFRDMTLEELKESPRLKAHANRVIKVFDDSVQVLDDDSSQLEEIWVKVTQSHFNRQIEKQSFNELKEVILEVLTAACSLNDQQIEIWVKLMDFIYDIIFRTIDELEQGA
ncbi:cytoglobin-2-like [Glossina fuscipes]|uniref:Cytoglobin-2-like n=1 Tax=Glossina fuscipes TaxID=7396 RepID=A0A9C6DXP8_9MUSC|nr:cytoglobin-2-like [Glossina fuscipes]